MSTYQEALDRWAVKTFGLEVKLPVSIDSVDNGPGCDTCGYGGGTEIQVLDANLDLIGEYPFYKLNEVLAGILDA